eukprot:gnl/TRDRNA2_/TRDRNA2_177359_c5_seq17.p1 gnl/TRDRNA2_/TRDRNA2_177359_c5~~gnl/TRDRNA2_/TRDRNA2_177359_c5_seq17.p1  ORF type:complete len:156 (+),score=22.92 gnl/TRDRNA2_/TRDRNA2_177359_c5_seq17:371-838(+)
MAAPQRPTRPVASEGHVVEEDGGCAKDPGHDAWIRKGRRAHGKGEDETDDTVNGGSVAATADASAISCDECAGLETAAERHGLDEAVAPDTSATEALELAGSTEEVGLNSGCAGAAGKASVLCSGRPGWCVCISRCCCCCRRPRLECCPDSRSKL